MNDERALSLGFTAGLQAAATAVAREPMPSAEADRDARVAELQRQYRSGEYRVDPATLASKIVDDHLA